jgi:transposase
MRFVPNKSIEQRDLQALHRIRSRMIGSRTQLGNQIRGLLAEYGIVLPLHLSQVRTALPRLIEDDNPLMSGLGRRLLAALYEELCALEQRIDKIEEQVQQIYRSNALCQKMYPEVIEEWKTFAQLAGDRNESDFTSALEQGFRSATWKGALAKGIEVRKAQRKTAYSSKPSLAMSSRPTNASITRQT